jgi:WD40 repeat protein
VKHTAETTRHGAETARREAETARHEAEATRRKAETTRYDAETARSEAEIARSEAETCRSESGAQFGLGSATGLGEAAGRLDGAAMGLDETSRRLDGAAMGLDEAAMCLDRAAIHKAGIADVASIEVNDILKALPTSLDLATDCLRLSVYFFHPIQQCSQQVYHTALPLSPTSSHLRNSWLRSVTDDHLPRVTAFVGAPDTWGLLLRTIDVRPGQLTCIATSAWSIIAACGDTVNIYDAVTFVLRQSLRTLEAVTKIQDSADGSTLFFAHSHSVTMWDVQTGGLTHTFTTRSEITDIAVSTTGDHIACGSFDGCVTLWNIHTKKEGKRFWNSHPVGAIRWLSFQELAFATQSRVCVCNIATGKASAKTSTSGHVWGMVYPANEYRLVIGTSQLEGAGQELCSFEIIEKIEGLPWILSQQAVLERRLRTHLGPLLCPTLVGEEIVCITPPSGVRSFDTRSCDWNKTPPLLDAVTSVTVSLNRNLVAQTKDSIQIFSFDVLRSGEARNGVRPSHVYPLGERHIICLLQPTRHLVLLELETLRELNPYDGTLPPEPIHQSPHARASFSRGFVAEFGISAVMDAWRSCTPLPEWTEATDEDPSLSRLSPDCTQIVTFHGSPRRELRVKDVKDGTILAKLRLEHGDLGTGDVYDVTFDSETRFHLKIDRPGRHVQIPYDIIASPSGPHSFRIIKGKPVPLSKPRATPPYTLDANCEWVVDAESRKICWISPGNVRRGSGGHFWAGLSLVMVGGDGVVRKLTFREPDS